MPVQIKVPPTPSLPRTPGASLAGPLTPILSDHANAINRKADAVAPSYTVATLPSADPAGQIIYVSDETDGATLAFSDGTNWRRMADRTVVS